MAPARGLWQRKVAPDVLAQSNVMAEPISLASLSTPAEATEPAEALRPDGGNSVKPQQQEWIGKRRGSDLKPPSLPLRAGATPRSHIFV
jgi:hypothetical protein